MVNKTDSNLKVSRKGVLREAFEKIKDKGELFSVRDKYGIIGYVLLEDELQALVVAKPRPYGYIVSMHKWMFDKALDKGLEIWFYIGNNKCFYVLEPEAIVKDRETFHNKRGDIEMINFSLQGGQRMDDPRQMRFRL